jgi:phosphate starvation-inducible PhoH-like protein
MSNTIRSQESIFLEFHDNQKLASLVGPQDSYFQFLEKKLDVQLALRGNRVSIIGEERQVHHAKVALQYLYTRSLKGFPIDMEDVETALRISLSPPASHQGAGVKEEVDKHTQDRVSQTSIATKNRIISPRSTGQARYLEALRDHNLVFGIGPAGTGKTYLAVAMGVSMLMTGKVERIILSRPAVEAGERLGFLPGDMREKVDPYLRPLYDALNDMLPPQQVMRSLDRGEIEIAPLAFMRGRTLSDAFVILDEAQNTSPGQMKMFLTRLGRHSRMVVTGDLTQIDLPPGMVSGLQEAVEVLKGVEDVEFMYFDERDVVRHPIVARIIKAYEQKKGKRDPS